MATFKVQIEDITGAVGDDAGLTQWLTDGVKEIINILPPELKEKCMTETTLNNSSPTMDLDGVGEILYVSRLSANSGGYRISCRKVPSMHSGLTSDSSSLYYGTVTDPVYWIQSTSDAAILNVYPSPEATQTARVYHIGYTAAAHGDSVIANFPDEAEYLVVLYAAIKGLHRLQNDLLSNSDITTALTAVNTELDETQAICDLINTQVDAAVVELAESAALVDSNIDTAVAAIATALGRVNTAVALANTEFDLVNPEVDLANTAVDDEDMELASGYISTAQGFSLAGKNYLEEASSSLSEAQGYVNEVTARTTHVSSQVSVAQGYINAAQGYVSELQSKTNIAAGYIGEAKTRMERDSQKYQWYQVQQVKLQQDYDKGIAMLVSKGIPQPAKQERAR